MRRIAATLLAVACLATGCSEDPAPGENGRGIPPPHPSGAYEVTSIEVDGEPRTPVSGTAVRMEFEQGTVSIDAGCNHLRADYTLGEETIEFEQLGGTEMGCPEDRMAQDAWLGEVLPGEWELTGSESFELVAGDTHLTLAPFDQDDQELLGTTWRLDSLISGDSVTSAPRGVRATLRLNKRNELMIDDGCNTGGGQVTVGVHAMTIGDVMTTLIGCLDPGRRQVGKAYSRVLRGTVDYEVDGDRLTITKGKHGLGFTAR